MEGDRSLNLFVNLSGPATHLERDISITVYDEQGTALSKSQLDINQLDCTQKQTDSYWRHGFFLVSESMRRILTSIHELAQFLQTMLLICCLIHNCISIDPADYSFSQTVLHFNCSDNRTTGPDDGEEFSIIINDDQEIEGDENFLLTILSSTDNNVIIDYNETIITILDDECKSVSLTDK